jgi:hypothetical protein
MGANSVHLIIDSFAFSVQPAFYSEGWEFIGNDAKGPTGRVRRDSIVAECKDFWRGSIFIAFTERTKSTDWSSFLWHKIRGSPTPLCGNDHPSSMDRIFSQLGHRGFFFRREFMPKRGNFF